MRFIWKALKKYIILVRAYSIIDVILLFLLARMVAQGNNAYYWKDFPLIVSALCLWGVLCFSLEAKHDHSYREKISYVTPGLLLALAISITCFFNILALLFVGGIVLTTICYISKEEDSFWGKTSFLWRGLYEVFLFFYCYSFYNSISSVGKQEMYLAIIIFLFYAARNLIADIRDIAFDPLTLVVFWGVKWSYLIAWFFFMLGSIILLWVFPPGFVAFPAVIISIICMLYDDGYMLHRFAIITTSFTWVNIMLWLQQDSLLYSHLLLLGVFSNFLFYEKVPRLSNPIARVHSKVRFLFKK